MGAGVFADKVQSTSLLSVKLGEWANNTFSKSWTDEGSNSPMSVYTSQWELHVLFQECNPGSTLSIIPTGGGFLVVTSTNANLL